MGLESVNFVQSSNPGQDTVSDTGIGLDRCWVYWLVHTSVYWIISYPYSVWVVGS